MISFIVPLVLTIFTVAYGQYTWDRINSNVEDISAKGSHLFAVTPNKQLLKLVNNVWTQIDYTTNSDAIIRQIAASSDGGVFILGAKNYISRYTPTTKVWDDIITTNKKASINAKDLKNLVGVSLSTGNVAKYTAGTWAPVGGSDAVGGLVNRAVAIGTDGAIFKITEQGVLSKFDGNAFTTITLDPSIGEPVRLDVHSATRVVVLDYTQTPFLYDGNTFTNIGGGFNCLKVTIDDTKVYCIDPHGCLRSVTA